MSERVEVPEVEPPPEGARAGDGVRGSADEGEGDDLPEEKFGWSSKGMIVLWYKHCKSLRC